MNPLDAFLLVGMAPFAVRGLFRGFCREAFGVAGVVAGVFAAAVWASRLQELLVQRGLVGDRWAPAVAFAAVFLGVVVVANVSGVVADRLFRALFLGWLNRLAGLVFGAMKGATLLGFGLLAAERLVTSPAFLERVAASRLGRPLERLATVVFDTGRNLAAESQA